MYKVGYKYILLSLCFLSGMAQPFSRKISPNEIEKKINAYLLQTFQNSSVIRYEILNLKTPSNLLVKDPNYDLVVSTANISLPRGNTVFTLQLIENSEIKRTATVNCMVKTWERVFRASRNFKNGEVISAMTVIPDTVETSRLKPGYITRISRIENTVTTRRIRHNDIIYDRNIKPKPVIRKGDKIKLIFDDGSLKITVQAKSLGEGAIGDEIYVKNLQSGKRLKAKITRPGEVKIQ